MALAIFLATGVTMQAQDRLTQYKVRNAISVRTPIMNDSINPKGEKHTKKMLLQTPVVLHLPDAPMQSLTADTAGYLSFEKADKDNKLYLVKTQIRAERFLKGKLKITSPVRWEGFIDGASKQVKDAAEDSITSGSSRDITLSLEPERDYEIIIKLLSASDDKAAPTLKCELIKDEKFKDIACNLDPEAKKRFSLDNTVYGNRAIAVSISPSGKYLLTRYWDNHAAKRSRTYCELTELKSGKVLLTNLRDGMSWMPKSDKLPCHTPRRNNFAKYSRTEFQMVAQRRFSDLLSPRRRSQRRWSSPPHRKSCRPYSQFSRTEFPCEIQPGRRYLRAPDLWQPQHISARYFSGRKIHVIQYIQRKHHSTSVLSVLTLSGRFGNVESGYSFL